MAEKRRFLIVRGSDGNDVVEPYTAEVFDTLQQACDVLSDYAILMLINREQERKAREQTQHWVKVRA